MSHTPKKEKGVTDYERLQIAKREIENLLNASKWKDQLAFTIADVTVIMHMNKSTVGDLIRSGKIRAMHCGKLWRIPKEALVEWWVNMALEGRKGQTRRKETWIDEPD